MLRSAVCRNDANLNSSAQGILTVRIAAASDQALPRQRWLSGSSQQHNSRQPTITKAATSCIQGSCLGTCRSPATVATNISILSGYGSQSRTFPAPARAVPDAHDSSEPDTPEQAVNTASGQTTGAAAAPAGASNQGVQKQPSVQSQQQQGPNPPPAQTGEGRSSPPQQQQQQLKDVQQQETQQQQPLNIQQQLLTAGQFRQQLVELVRQQQQLQQVLDATAAAGLQGLGSNRDRWSRKRSSSSSLRTAAATSTDLLLLLLQRQLPVLTGKVPLQPGLDHAAAAAAAAPPPTADVGVDAVQASQVDPAVLPQQQQQQGQQQQQTEQQQRGMGGSRPLSASTQRQQRSKPKQQQGRTKNQQQQRTKPQQLQPQGRKYCCAPGSPPHLPLLAEALTTIAWHCRRQQLLPSEAGRLQGLLLSQLLPALRPNLAQLNKRQLARLVFSLGSCYAAAAGQEQEQEEGQQQQPPGMQGEAKLRSSGPNPQQQQQQQQQHGGATLNQEEPAETSESAAGVAAVPKDSLSPDSSSGGSRGRRPSPSLRAARAAAAAAAASAAWVLRLLPLLPPSSLTAGALLSVWQGSALHELRPPGDWLQQASWVMVGHLRGRKLDFNDMAGLLQACAALEYRPPGWLMVPLVSDLQQKLGMLTPADLAGVLSSLQTLSYRPPDTWLRVWCEVSSRHLAGMTLPQLASAAGALAWTSYTPAPWWGRRLTAAALPLLPVATADELLLLLHSLLTLRLGVPAGWVHQAYCHLARQRWQLGLSQLADAAHVLGGMGGLPPDVVRVHRAWLAVCLQRVGGWQGGAAAAALSRSELLYMLYAAARLRVSPGDTLTAAALHRLHQELALASPAELAGCLSVFCFWWRQQQQQTMTQQQEVEDGSGGDAATASSSSSCGGGGSTGSSSSSSDGGGRRVMSLAQLRDCLFAVVGCSSQFSGEGLLQLLMTCAKADLASTPTATAGAAQEEEQPPAAAVAAAAAAAVPPPPASAASEEGQPSQQQQQHDQDARLLLEVECSIESLVGELLRRLPGLSLVQLARLNRSLEAGPSSSSISSSGSSAGSGSSSGSSSASGVIGKGSSGSAAAGLGVGEVGRSRPEWYEWLSREVKAAMGARA